MKAYIQEVPKKYSTCVMFYTAFSGFLQKGFDVKTFFNKQHILSLPCKPECPIVAEIEPTINFFKHNNISVPKPLNIPVELNDELYVNRSLRLMTMGEFKKAFREKPTEIFIKPYDTVKVFPSGTIDKVSVLELVYNDVPDDTMVLISSIVDFVSEYRCFVYKGELQAIQHYKGSIEFFPNVEVIKLMIRVYKSAPVAYTLDVGITWKKDNWCEKTQTLLVECNDMWSVDNYGLNANTYSSMLRDRWSEIILK